MICKLILTPIIFLPVLELDGYKSLHKINYYIPLQ
jgi:hypothetical protein